MAHIMSYITQAMIHGTYNELCNPAMIHGTYNELYNPGNDTWHI